MQIPLTNSMEFSIFTISNNQIKETDMKLIIAILVLIVCTSAQNINWECTVTNKTVTGKDYTKTWDLTKSTYTHQTKDTIITINMSNGFIRIFSFTKTKVKKTCKSLSLTYDNAENYCDGYLSTDLVKKVLQGKVPKKVINDVVDTMDIEDVITMFTDKDIVVETIKFNNGYGERLNKRGNQNSFELEISRDDEYYFEATNGTLTKSNIKINKRINIFEMSIDATAFLNTYFEMKGTCTATPSY